MRIDDQYMPGFDPAKISPSKAQEATGTAGIDRAGPRSDSISAGSDSDDAVQLSSLASRLSALAANSAERQAYVERLEGAVAAGSYRVDAEALGESILEEALNAPSDLL